MKGVVHRKDFRELSADPAVRRGSAGHFNTFQDIVLILALLVESHGSH